MHISVSKLTTIGSDNGLLPGRCQTIIWTNACIFLIEPLGTNFNEILSKIHTFSFKKVHLRMSSRNWWPFFHGLNVFIGGSIFSWWWQSTLFQSIKTEKSLDNYSLWCVRHSWVYEVLFHWKTFYCTEELVWRGSGTLGLTASWRTANF